MSGYLQEVYKTFEILVSYCFVCGFFHISSTSVSPGLKMGQLISFWTSVFWLFFLGYASCSPQQHVEDCNGLLLVFKSAVGHRWLLKCFHFNLTLHLLQVSSDSKTADRILSCHSRTAGCRVRHFRSLKPIVFINFNQFLVQCVTFSWQSSSITYLSSSPFKW